MLSDLALATATFMICLAISSISGAASYFVVRAVGKAKFRWMVLFWLTYITVFAVTLGEYPWTYLLIVLCLPFCCIGATAEKASRKLADDWDTQMAYLFGACLLSIVFNIWSAVAWQWLVVPTGSVRTATSLEDLFLWLGLIVGTVASPMAISLFRWLFLASRLCPGVDRPFDSHEMMPDSHKDKQ